MKKTCLRRVVLPILFTITAATARAELVFQPVSLFGGQHYKSVIDTSTSLQWLSPVATQRQSFESVSAGYGGWLSAGFKYASSLELISLLAGSGVPTSSSQLASPSGQSWTRSSDVKALQALLTAIGWTYENNQPGPGSLFGQRTVYGILDDTFPHIADTPVTKYYASFWVGDSSAFASIPGSQIYTGAFDGSVGSFLVRSVTAVPEPSSFVLMIFGLGLLGALVRRQPAV